jgi:hypothetical protein
MIEFFIADLMLMETEFSVPVHLGQWHFTRLSSYTEALEKVMPGQCANTYFAQHQGISRSSADFEVEEGIYELLDICLVLSWLTARCVTPTGPTPASELTFVSLPQHFLLSRSITGFHALNYSGPLDAIFSDFPRWSQLFLDRNLRLFLSLWVSGLTAFTLEDLFMRVAVNMDIVKQCEIRATGRKELNYFEGMEEASRRYGLTPLSADYKNMRNDIVHEGRLSASKYKNKSKSHAAATISDTLNWIDRYLAAILSIGGIVNAGSRWRATELQHGLPSISL